MIRKETTRKIGELGLTLYEQVGNRNVADRCCVGKDAWTRGSRRSAGLIIFLGPRPVRSAGLKIFLVRVRSGPRISKFSWSASGPVRGPLLFSGWSGPFFLESYLDKFHVRRSKIQHYRNRSPSQMKMVQVIGAIIRNAYLKLERAVGKLEKL